MEFDLNNIYYQYLVKYHNEFGNINVPINYKINLGDGKTLRLGYFVNGLRKKYRNGQMTLAEKRFLKELHISWYPLDDAWTFMYELAKEYKDTHGNLDIKRDYKVTKEGKDYNLGRWLERQKRNYKWTVASNKNKKTTNDWYLKDERIKMLDDLDIDWRDAKEQKWFAKYRIAFKFYQKHGNLKMPKDFKTSLNNKDFNLYDWLLKNKRKYLFNKEDLSDEQIEALKIIDITKFNNLEITWQFMYNEACKYYKKHGNLKVNAKYSYYTLDGTLVNLGYWINSQRRKYKNAMNPDKTSTYKGKLSLDEIELLDEIGMVWKTNISFDDIYPYLLIYYQHYGNLNIPCKFKTDDGYTYKEKGSIALGSWLNSFKNNVNPLGENALLLTQMGLKYPARINEKVIKEICREKKIDYEFNLAVLKRISYIEFVSKVAYLEENNIPLVSNKGIHAIFSMSSKDINCYYKISLEEIIDKYYSKHLQKNRSFKTY